MKIVFFGNINNFPFKIAKELRETYNVDSHIIINRKDLLHRPESYYPEYSNGYPKWIIDRSELVEDDYVSLTNPVGEILNFLEDSHLIILNDYGPSLFPYLNRKAITFLTGSDLTYYANFETLQTRTKNWDSNFKSSPWGILEYSKWKSFIERQRQGLKKSEFIGMGVKGMVPEMDTLAKEIGIPDFKKIPALNSDTEYFRFTPIKKKTKLRVLMTARLCWTLPMKSGFSEQDFKANDVFLKAMSGLSSSELSELEIYLPEKGSDIIETKELIKSLGLEYYVSWFENLPIHQYKKALEDADVIIESMGNGLMGIAGLDAMSVGRVVIAHKRNFNNLENISGKKPIIEGCANEKDILSVIRYYLKNRNELSIKGKLASDYVQNHFSLKAFTKMVYKKIQEILK